MTPREIIDAAVSAGHTSLPESRSKELLANYQLPIIKEAVAKTIEEATALADQIGFPIVLKANAPGIIHKTEAGLIAMNLGDAGAVRQESDRLLSAAPEGSQLLIQEMVRGDRELMIGMKRDTQYGPCVSIGLGGIFTEALNDTALRLAPLSQAEALDMLDDFRAAEILASYRGMKPADRDILVAALMGMGQCAQDHPDIAEIDVNPIIITDAGRPVAVDALVVLSG